MTTTKIKIDLAQGVIEAEGTETFVLSIHSDFKEQIAQSKTSAGSGNAGKKHGTVKKKEALATKKSSTEKASKKVSASESTGKLIKDLDLSGEGKKHSLRGYYNQYKVKTNLERNLVFSYYLEQELALESFGIDEIFTCYRNINKLKVPGNLKQSLYDTSAKGWIEIKSIEDGITVPVSGLNHIEHDLERNE